MRKLSIVLTIAVLASVSWISWSYAGLREKFLDVTLEQRARSAIGNLRDRVDENRDKGRAFKIRAEIQRIKLERMETERARYDDAARRMGEAGRRAERAGAEETVAHNGRRLTQAEARQLTVAWGTRAQSLQRQIVSRGALRDRLGEAVGTLETTNARLTAQTGDLELKLEEMLVQKEEAELLATLGEVNRAVTTGEGGGELGVFKELQDKIDLANATATVLDAELGGAVDSIDTPLESEILDQYWR